MGYALSFLTRLKKNVSHPFPPKAYFQLAGFFFESILSCGGQIVPPEGYLRQSME